MKQKDHPFSLALRQGVPMELIQAFSPVMVACCLATQAQAADITVPNSGFEILYKPGETTITADTGGGWTQGVGPNAAMEGGLATYSDATTGTAVDVPGWVNAPATGTPPDGGWAPPYGWPKGSGVVARQLGTPYGTYYYSVNGTNWGNPNGGAIESAAPLTAVVGGETYTISMSEGPGLTNHVLDLLADGVILTPDSSSSSPDGTWTLRANKYSAASLASSVGKSLRIRVGWAVGAAGARAQLDNVKLVTSVPDTTAPTLTSFEHNKGSGPIVINGPVTYTVTFSEPMNAMTVDATDFENTSTTEMTVDSVTPTLDPAVFLVGVTPTALGRLQLRVKAGAILKDLESNSLNTSLAIPDDSSLVVTDDPVPPTLTSIADNVGGGPIIGGQTVIYTVTFSEAMNATTVDVTDFDNAGDPPATINSVTSTIDPAVFTVSVTSAGGDGTLRLQIMADAILTDLAGNTMVTLPALDNTTIITTPPPTFRWQGANGADWSVAGNWNTKVPGASDTAVLSDNASAGARLNLDTDVTIGGLLFNNEVVNQTIASTSGKTLTMASGSLITVDAGSHSISANVNALTADAAKQLKKSGSGTLILSGAANSVAGSFIVDGGSLTIPSGATLAVGGQQFTVRNGSTVEVSGIVNSTTWSTIGMDVPGSAESTMILKDSAQFNNINGFLTVGDTNANDGRLIIQDSAQVNSSLMILGQYGGAPKGYVIQNSGTVNLTNANGQLWYVCAALQIGSGAALVGWTNGQGEYHLNGGTLTAHSIGGGGGASPGSGRLYFNGGTLKPTVSDDAVATKLSGIGQTLFMQNLTQVIVQQNGAIIDTNDQTISIDQSLLPGTGAGGLTKQGLGTLKLLQAASYTGPTKVQGGTLECATAAAVAPTALEIDAAAKVDLAYTGNRNIPSLKIGATVMVPGVYGSSSSPAPLANRDDVHFAGTGTVTVTVGYAGWAATNAPGQTPDQDHDNDGVENGLEYFMGQTGSSFTAMPGLGGTNTVTWTMDPAYNGTYEVQTSPDLGTWTNVTPKPLPAGGNLSYTLPTGLGKHFVRLLVTPAL